jgi:hypothetical protein
MAHDLTDAGALAPLVGSWTVEAEFPDLDPPVVRGRATFDWLLGRRFLVQRVEVDHPDAPDSHGVVAPDPDSPGAYRQHYFDARGVVRLYAMTFDGREWTLTRREPDFSPLDFAQRFVGLLSEDGDSIEGRWEIADGEGGWRPDFRLTYRRSG